MKVAVIGAGITGLTTAYELCKNGIDVDIFESDSQTGGIAGVTYINNTPIEKCYHHFFKSDKYILELLDELRISNSIKWIPSSMGFFADNKIYTFGTPTSLLGFRPLNFVDKLKFGVAVLKIMGIKDWKQLESITAHQWLINNVGDKVYSKVWKPLLVSKFGENYRDIAMSWFWGKLNLRGKSKENGVEVLGYIEGSNKILLDTLEQELEIRGVRIRLNCRVREIEKNENYRLKTTWGEFEYDKIVCTIPLPIFLNLTKKILPESYVKEKSQIQYTASVCTILILRQQFSKYYWMNIGDGDIPFGGLIEHTNLLDKDLYGNQHVLYISNYLFKDSIYFKMDENQLVNEYTRYLKKINPKFDEYSIISKKCYRDIYAQPIIKKHYSTIKPGFESPIEGVYTASMCSIYPEDRGVNYAVREGRNVALKLIGDI